MIKFIIKILNSLEEFNLQSNISATSETETPEIELTEEATVIIPEAELEILILRQRNTLINVFKLLNYSLLSGEYIGNLDIKEDIEQVIEKLSSTFNLTNDFEEEAQTVIFELNSTISIAIGIYKFFISDIENKYSDNRIDFLFSFDKQTEKNIQKSNLSNTSKNLIDYFTNHVSLSRNDHFPSSEDNRAEALFTIENSIDNSDILEFEKLSKLLKLKLDFLKHKWKARKQQENPSSIYYSIDGSSTILAEYSSDNAKLNEWGEVINFHYELNNQWKFQIQEKVKRFKNKPLGELNYLQIHQLIKYYKDVKKSYSKLVEISSFLLGRVNDNNFNSYCLSIFTNYSLNNQFSLFVEKEENIPLIKEEYQNIKDKKRGEINNFFLEFKYLNSIIDILLKKIEEDNNVEFIKKYEKTVTDECKGILGNYYQNKEWAKRNHNYIFQLPFDECLVPIDKIDDLENIFIASSFILPPVNDIIESHYSEIRQKYKSITLYVDIIKRLKKDLEKIEDLNKAFDKRDFKSIEIISIFTAIITFILSSIPAYKFIESVWDSLLFMLSLASALGIFVMLILFSTRGFKDNYRGVFYLIVLCVIAVVGYNSLVNFEKKEGSISKKEKQSIDSIVNTRVDSIIKLIPQKREMSKN